MQGGALTGEYRHRSGNDSAVHRARWKNVRRQPCCGVPSVQRESLFTRLKSISGRQQRSAPTSSNAPDKADEIRTKDGSPLLLGAVLAVVAAVFIILAVPLLSGRIWTFDDLGHLHLPYRTFYANCLRSGDSFLWAPDFFLGFYLHGEGQVGMLHPLHLLLHRFLPVAVALNIEILLSYLFMLSGMYLFLRLWKLGRAPALMGAFIFAFSGFNLLHFMHVNIVTVVAHLPWFLVCAEVALNGRGSRRVTLACLGTTAVMASAILMGHPHALWLSSVAMCLYVLFRGMRWEKRRRLALYSAAVALGVLIGAVQLLPTWDATQESVRQNPIFGLRYEYSLTPPNLAQFVAPYTAEIRALTGRNTQEFGIYNGAAAMLLTIWAFLRRKHLGALRPLAIGSLALAALGVVLSLGKYGYLYRVQAHMPVIGLFRCSCRYILLTHLAMAIASAIALADIARIQRDPPHLRRGHLTRKRLWILMLLPLASVAVAAGALIMKLLPYGPWMRFVPRLAATPAILAGPLLMLLAAAAIIAAIRWGRIALAALAVLAMADVAVYGLTFIMRNEPQGHDSYMRSVGKPPGDPDGRLDVRPMGVKCLMLTLHGYTLIDGYGSLIPARFMSYKTLPALRVAGVRWQGRWLQPRGIPAKPIARPKFVQVPDPLPRARLVTRAVVADRMEVAINRVDVDTTALVFKELDLEDGRPGTARITEDRPGRIAVQTHCTSRQLLIVSEGNHPGWQATVDGKPAEMIPVYGDFLGCVVGPGASEVRFVFRPWSFVWGAWISASGLLLTAVTFAFVPVALRRRQNRLAAQNSKPHNNPQTPGGPARKRPSVSVIVPTYREAENLPELIDRIEKVRNEFSLDLDLLIMDDDSRDGTEQIVRDYSKPWVHLIVRKANRGLSPAVLDGMQQAAKDALLVMDADLSHPPEKIPEMLDALAGGHDFVIGSRYVRGGSTGGGWSVLRLLNSKAATLMARPLTTVKDPMSGFFALPHSLYAQARHSNLLDPIGYKIGLELLVKCGCKQVCEVPITFTDRQRGSSKLSLREQLSYLRHLRRLYMHKYAESACLAQFMIIGAIGVGVNLLVLTALLAARVPLEAAVPVAIFTSMAGNFVLNRRFAFGYARSGNVWAQAWKFMAACSAGAAVNWAVTVGVVRAWPAIPLPQIAALIGIAVGTAFNYVASRLFVFRKAAQ